MHDNMFDVDRDRSVATQPEPDDAPVDDVFAEEPATEAPFVEDDVVEDAAIEETATEESATEGFGTEGSVTEGSVVVESAPGASVSEEPSAEEAVTAEPATPRKRKDNRNWFVVHTYSGYENKVKANLERRIHSMGMQDKIFRVLVPMEDEVEFKDGKRKITPKKVFPGYVLVEMIMDDQSWYVVRNTQGVTGFVGSPGPGEKPVPLQDKEVKTILKQMGIEAPKLKIDFRKGDRVKVTSGPFFDFTGVVDEIAPEKERLRALISIFGRETPVELEFFQVEKV
jgi:transcription termination/antitermination protein NusG